jgi:hypothetical protein
MSILLDDQILVLHDRNKILGKFGFSLEKKPAPDMKLIDKVTPAIAHELLTLNMKNRKISEPRVLNLIAQLESGFFVGENTIKFDWNGELIDGQHRLTAISRMEKDFYVPMYISVNNDPEMRYVIDTGRPRNSGETLTIMGHKDGKLIPSILRGALFGQYLKFKTATAEKKACCPHDIRSVMSTKETEFYYLRLKDAFDFVIELTKKRVVSVPMTSQIRGVILRSYYHEQHDKITSFVSVYMSGHVDEAMSASSNNAILDLRMSLNKKEVKGDRVATYGLFEKGLRNFCLGITTPVKKPTSVELYPVQELDKKNSVNKFIN